MPGKPKNLTLCPYPCGGPSAHVGAPVHLQTPTPALPAAQPQADGQRWPSRSWPWPCSLPARWAACSRARPGHHGSAGAPPRAALPLPWLLEAPRGPFPPTSLGSEAASGLPHKRALPWTQETPRWRPPVRVGVWRRGRKEISGISLSLGHALQGLMLTWLSPSPALACSPGCCS